CRRHPAVSPCLSFNDTAPTYSSPLSLHDALPILGTPPCSNEYVHGMWKRNEGRIIQAWAAVEPAKGEIAIRQARQAIQEFGMIGFHFHPIMQHFSVDDRRYYPLFEEIAHLGAAVMIDV